VIDAGGSCYIRYVDRAGDWLWRGLVIATLPLSACVLPSDSVSGDSSGEAELGDDPLAYLTDPDYRRAILERDLVSDTPIYAQVRLRHYARGSGGWDELPVVDWSSAPLTLALAAELAATQSFPAIAYDPPLSAAYELAGGPDLDALSDAQLDALAERVPQTEAEWVALGERVFFAYPMSLAPSLAAAVRAGVDLRDYGVLVDDDAYVGVRVIEDAGAARIAVTCASCHASIGAAGRPDGVRANRDYDFGRLRIDFGGGAAEAHAVDATALEHLAALGPGRSDVQNDGLFNPYAFPDFGGIAQMPYLHHTANWHNRGVATLAIRIETVFVSASDRPPRVLTWALAEYLRSLPAPAPVAEPSPASLRGAAVFEAQGCAGCHTPPLYTSDVLVSVAELGTDDAAGTSPVRATGYWRVPSLRGVGGNAPYLHHGPFATLEAMFEPERAEPGHRFGLTLAPSDRADLLAFLRTI
jgi:mono/diheme cytochrome c family protein